MAYPPIPSNSSAGVQVIDFRPNGRKFSDRRRSGSAHGRGGRPKEGRLKLIARQPELAAAIGLDIMSGLSDRADGLSGGGAERGQMAQQNFGAKNMTAEPCEINGFVG